MMEKFLAAIGVVVALTWAGIIYPQTMVLESVTETETGGYIAILCSSDGNIFSYEVGEPSDLSPGDVAAVIMCSNATPDDVTDDAILAIRFTGFSMSSDNTESYVMTRHVVETG